MKQPVYIRADFVNAYVELSEEGVKKLVNYANQLQVEEELEEEVNDDDD